MISDTFLFFGNDPKKVTERQLVNNLFFYSKRANEAQAFNNQALFQDYQDGLKRIREVIVDRRKVRPIE